jgi:hypothetical protein
VFFIYCCLHFFFSTLLPVCFSSLLVQYIGILVKDMSNIARKWAAKKSAGGGRTISSALKQAPKKAALVVSTVATMNHPPTRTGDDL